MTNYHMILKSLAALLVSAFCSLLLGHFYIKWTTKTKFNQPINPDGPTNHIVKEGTPTSGGLFFIFGIIISTLIFNDIKHPYTYIPLIALITFALIGLLDDFLKVSRKESIGLRTSQKLAMQILVGSFILYIKTNVLTFVPSSLGVWESLAHLLYIVTIVNAVNISDGLDGLAAGIAFSPLLLLVLIAAVFGISNHIDFVHLSIQEGSLHLLIVITAVIGSLLAFLWYNGSKALVFMGDVGSHALGAFIAVSALLLRSEFVVLVASALFFIEVLSSLVQIISIRFYSKKVFKMAPLHHHFEQKGVAESRIVTRFQVASAIFGVAAAFLFLIKFR